MHDLGLVGLGLDQCGFVPKPVGGRTLPAKDQGVARGQGTLNESFDALEVIGMNERRHRRGGIATVAENVKLAAGCKSLEELVANALFHNEAGSGETDLAGVVVHERGFFHGEIQVGVGVHHEGTLSAEFAGEGNEVSRGDGPDATTRFGRSGKGDPSHARIRHQRRPDLGSDALDQIEHTGRELGFKNEIHQQRTTEG